MCLCSCFHTLLNMGSRSRQNYDYAIAFFFFFFLENADIYSFDANSLP